MEYDERRSPPEVSGMPRICICLCRLLCPLPFPLPLPFHPPLFSILTFASVFTPRIWIPLPLPLSLPRQWKKITTVPPTVIVARTPKLRVIYVQLLYPLVLCDTVTAWILYTLPCIYDLNLRYVKAWSPGHFFFSFFFSLSLTLLIPQLVVMERERKFNPIRVKGKG